MSIRRALRPFWWICCAQHIATDAVKQTMYLCADMWASTAASPVGIMNSRQRSGHAHLATTAMNAEMPARFLAHILRAACIIAYSACRSKWRGHVCNAVMPPNNPDSQKPKAKSQKPNTQKARKTLYPTKVKCRNPRIFACRFHTRAPVAFSTFCDRPFVWNVAIAEFSHIQCLERTVIRTDKPSIAKSCAICMTRRLPVCRCIRFGNARGFPHKPRFGFGHYMPRRKGRR